MKYTMKYWESKLWDDKTKSNKQERVYLIMEKEEKE